MGCSKNVSTTRLPLAAIPAHQSGESNPYQNLYSSVVSLKWLYDMLLLEGGAGA